MTVEAPQFRRRSLLHLSWPLVAVTVFTLLGTLGNVVLLSIASPALNAAVATANQLLGVLYDVSVIFSLGALVVIAQALGAGAMDAARRATVVVLRASSLLGVAMAVGIAALTPALLVMVNTPPEIVPDASAYLWVVAAGLAFNAYIVAATAVLRGYGRTVAILVLGVVVNLLDVALLAVFLLVLDLGVVGAALPTLLVRGLGVLLLARLVRVTTGVGVFSRVPAATDARVEAPTMVRLSVPTVVENSVYNGVIVYTLTMINLHGTDAINARSYALTLTSLVTGVILALAQGNETIVGWDVGERSREHAFALTLRTAAWTSLAASVLAGLLWLGADGALAVFGVNAAVLEQARTGLLISVLLLPLSAVTSVVYGALRSTGDVLWPMGYSVAASLLVLAPASYLFIGVLGLGMAGVFWALTLAEAVRAGLLLIRWVRRRWAFEPALVDEHPASGVAGDERPVLT